MLLTEQAIKIIQMQNDCDTNQVGVLCDNTLRAYAEIEQLRKIIINNTKNNLKTQERIFKAKRRLV